MRALGLALGYAADRAFGDPARFHPVAGFGQVAAAVEHRTYADSRARGVAHVALLVGVPVLLCRKADGTLATAVVTWAVLGGASLAREAREVERRLDDLDAARQRVTHLVGRDPSALDESGIARAVIESVAENTSDAVVAPLVWGALAGVPGLVAHRCANTLDAMIGHRTRRYERFGWAAAHLDDVLNLPGSRLTAALAAAIGPDHRGALRAWRRDAAAHPSPNAGSVEAAYAGALGLRLGGETVYPERVEQRPVLGDGRAPQRADVERAITLADRVDLAALAVCVGVALLSRSLRRRAPWRPAAPPH